MVMPISFLLQQQDQEEVPDEVAEDSLRGDDPAPEVEVERSPVPDLSPPSPHPPPSTPASADTPGPSYTAQHSPEQVHVSSRELAAIMDAVCSLATTQESMDQRLARAKTTIEHCHTMLLQIMGHLGLPPEPTQRDQPPAAASLDMLAAVATAASDPPPPRECGGHTPVSNFPIPMTCLYFGWEEKLELGVSSIMFLYSFHLYQLPTHFV